MSDPVETRIHVALSIRACRESRGMSQGEVAMLADIDQSTVSHFETGSRLPSCENIIRLCRALEVSADELLGIEPVKHELSPADHRLVSQLRRRLANGLVRREGAKMAGGDHD